VTKSFDARGDAPIESSIPVGAVPLESILCTDELHRRPSRPPGYEEENRALVKLVSALSDSPGTILQTLTETILHITQCDSAGLSLLTRNGQTPDACGERFYWPAIAGTWNPHTGGGTPRSFGPCGDVLDRNCTLLFKHFERRYPYLLPVAPAAEECLLVPFYVAGKAVGTIWAIMHSDRRKFDAEDERVMGSLGKFASSAYQGLASIDVLRFQIGEREKAEAALQELADGLEMQVRVRTQELERSTEELLATNKELEKEITERRRAEQALIGAQSHLKDLADEQAALRRVATLVARGAPQAEVFSVVAREVAGCLGVPLISIVRFETDGTATYVGAWGEQNPYPIGTRGRLDPRSAMASVQATGRAARRDMDDLEWASPPETTPAGPGSTVASPILVEGRVWGAIGVGSRSERLPQDTGQRLADFTELVATAIANAASRNELTMSRARIVAAADQARRRIERDLHDGAQQRLVVLTLKLRAAQAAVSPELDELVGEATSALDELRAIAHGIHPEILSQSGLGAALRALARRSPIPVDLDVRTKGRLPQHVEASAYYLAAEALTNAAKHARASAVTITVEADTTNAILRVTVRDDGVGGADFHRGTGLIGLKDRVEALGGRIHLDSPRGAGTSLRAELPLTATNSDVTSDDK